MRPHLRLHLLRRLVWRSPSQGGQDRRGAARRRREDSGLISLQPRWPWAVAEGAQEVGDLGSIGRWMWRPIGCRRERSTWWKGSTAAEMDPSVDFSSWTTAAIRSASSGWYGLETVVEDGKMSSGMKLAWERRREEMGGDGEEDNGDQEILASFIASDEEDDAVAWRWGSRGICRGRREREIERMTRTRCCRCTPRRAPP